MFMRRMVEASITILGISRLKFKPSTYKFWVAFKVAIPEASNSESQESQIAQTTYGHLAIPF